MSNIKTFFYWGVGGLALIALAGPEPDLATILIIILIVGVLFTHWQEYLSMLSANTPTSVKK